MKPGSVQSKKISVVRIVKAEKAFLSVVVLHFVKRFPKPCKMNKRFEAGYGSRSHAKPTADAVQEQAAPAEENELPKQLDPFQSISLTEA